MSVITIASLKKIITGNAQGAETEVSVITIASLREDNHWKCSGSILAPSAMKSLERLISEMAWKIALKCAEMSRSKP